MKFILVILNAVPLWIYYNLTLIGECFHNFIILAVPMIYALFQQMTEKYTVKKYWIAQGIYICSGLYYFALLIPSWENFSVNMGLTGALATTFLLVLWISWLVYSLRVGKVLFPASNPPEENTEKRHFFADAAKQAGTPKE